MPNKTRALNESFADFFLSLGNPEEAALKAGCPKESALAMGLEMLGGKKVRGIIRKRRDSDICKAEALAGLRRLAFGRINDALALLKDDCCDGDFSHLDLFNVSEIKRVKGGGVEIRFFDRLEALKLLAETEEKAAGGDAADSFFSALRGSDGDGDD